MYNLIARLFPKKIKKNLGNLLRYSTIEVPPERFLGFQVLFILLLSLALSFYISPALTLPFFLVFIVLILLLETGLYVFLVLSADSKAKFIDSILPDVLQLMASNLRAGLTVDKAFFVSARPEFGMFKEELDRVGREVALGKKFEDALQELGRRIRSENLEKAVFLIVSAVRAGGELAPILEETAHDLREKEIADKKIRASIGMYFIFIFVAIGLALPFLFALSSIVVQVLISTFSAVTVPSSVSTPLNPKGSHITVEFIIMFANVFFITSSIMGSLMLGLIKTGRAKEGARYIPILLVLTFTIFYTLRWILTSSLGSLFGL